MTRAQQKRQSRARKTRRAPVTTVTTTQVQARLIGGDADGFVVKVDERAHELIVAMLDGRKHISLHREDHFVVVLDGQVVLHPQEWDGYDLELLRRTGADMVCEAVDAAVAARQQQGRSVAGTVLHSDRGGEFTATLTAQACDRHDLKRSMGDTGVCWDNAGAESFWSTFKHEHYYRHTYATRAELVAAVDNWIDWFTTERRHSAIGMLSPNRYEQSH